MDKAQDALVFDAIGGIAGLDSWPDYTRPSELSHITGLPVQAIGLIVSRIAGAHRIRDKGYQTTILIGAYRERQEKARQELERLELERLERLEREREIQDEISRVQADRLRIESDTKQIQSQIREIDKAIKAASETLTQEKATRRKAKSNRRTVREQMQERVHAREQEDRERQRRAIANNPNPEPGRQHGR